MKIGDCSETGRIIISEGRQKEFIKYTHELSGHVGMFGTYRNIYRYYKVENIKKKVVEVINECVLCKEYKNNALKVKNVVSIDSNNLFEKVSTDVYGPFILNRFNEEKDQERGYFITITNLHSRVSRVYFEHTFTGKYIVRAFKKWIKELTELRTIISDNGTEYNNKMVEKCFNDIKIKHVFIPTYAPFSNGISERINSIIAQVLNMNDGSEINIIRDKIMFRLNENVNMSLGVSPSSIYRGYNFFYLINTPVDYTKKEVVNKVKSSFEIGQKVYVKIFNKKYSAKEFLGPYEVIEAGAKFQWFIVEGIGWVYTRNIKA